MHTHFVGDPATSSDDTEENTYTFGGRIVGVNDDGTRHHVFTDHLSSTTATLQYGVGTGGSNIKRRLYAPFGDERGTADATVGDRTYTGQVDDETHTGLMFYNARYYDPVLRTFTSPDTIVPEPGNPLDFNRYLYVRGNPINYNDPSGHDACPSGGGGCYYDDRTDIWEFGKGSDQGGVDAVISVTSLFFSVTTVFGDYIHEVEIKEIGRGSRLRFDMYDAQTGELIHRTRTAPTFGTRTEMREMMAAGAKWRDKAPAWLRKNVDAGADRFLRKFTGPAALVTDAYQVTQLAVDVHSDYADSRNSGQPVSYSLAVAVDQSGRVLSETIATNAFGFYGAVVGGATCGPLCAAGGYAVGYAVGWGFAVFMSRE